MNEQSLTPQGKHGSVNEDKWSAEQERNRKQHKAKHEEKHIAEQQPKNLIYHDRDANENNDAGTELC